MSAPHPLCGWKHPGELFQTKCISHHKPASCILDGFWLWQQTPHICGVSFILGFTFANNAVFLNLTLLHGPNKYSSCLFPLSVSFWAHENRWEQGDACMLSCPVPHRLIYVTLQLNHRSGFLLCPLLPSCVCFMLVVFWSYSFLHAKGAAGKGIFFFLWVGESSILHNLSPFSASPHQIAILGSHVTCNKAPLHHRNMPINKFYIFFSSAAHHRSNFSK